MATPIFFGSRAIAIELLLMIVGEFHVMRTVRLPAKDDPPLIVDADRTVPRAIALERLQAVRGRRAQVFEASGRLQLSQLSQGAPQHIRWNPSGPRRLRAHG